MALLRALDSSKTVVQTLPYIYNYCDEVDSLQAAKNDGVVFLHALGGRDVSMFQQHFGSLFDEKCRVSQVSPRDLKKTYYVFSFKRAPLLLSFLLRMAIGRLENRAAKMLRRWKR